MKLKSENRNLEMSGFDNDVSTFKIKASGKAFKILSSNLYTDKILAVIRELGCNAYDAQISAGTSNKPFDVHLPNSFEPHFSIRDYGVGLSEHDIMNLYTTYFESTKSNDNDVVGCLGLGSKSPFAYVDQFTVTSFFAHEKKVYTVFMAQNGTPSIIKVSEELTTEPNGLEIHMMVNQNDFRAFAGKAQHIFKRFPVLPRITGNKDCKLQQLVHGRVGATYKVRNKLQNDHYNETYSGAYAVQGVVGYPIIYSKIDKFNLTDRQKSILKDLPIDIDFPIGELDIAPSREELSYDTLTQSNIYKALVKVEKELNTLLQMHLKPAKTEWEARKLWGDFFSKPFYRSSSGLDTDRFPIELGYIFGKELPWNGKKISSDQIRDINLNDEVLVDVTTPDGKQQKVKKDQPWGTRSYFGASKFKNSKITSPDTSDTKYITVDTNDIVVVCDKNRNPRGMMNILLHNYKDANSDVQLFKIDMTRLPELIKKLGDSTDIVKFDDLAVPVVELVDPITKVKKEVRRAFSIVAPRPAYEPSYCPHFNYTEIDLDLASAEGYYIVFYNGVPVAKGQEFVESNPKTEPELVNLIKFATRWGLFTDDNGAEIKFYGVNFTHRKSIKKNPKLINIYDFLEKKFKDFIETNLVKDNVNSYYTYLDILDSEESRSDVFDMLIHQESSFRSFAKSLVGGGSFSTEINNIYTFIDSIDKFYNELGEPIAKVRFGEAGNSPKNRKIYLDIMFNLLEQVLNLKPSYVISKTDELVTPFSTLEEKYPLLFKLLLEHSYKPDWRCSNPTVELNKVQLDGYVKLCNAAPDVAKQTTTRIKKLKTKTKTESTTK